VSCLTRDVRQVDFKHIFFADTLTSFNRVTSMMALGLCCMASPEYHASGGFLKKTPPSCGPNSFVQKYIIPALICLPLWLRLLQCLRRYHDSATRVPHIPNSYKYGKWTRAGDGPVLCSALLRIKRTLFMASQWWSSR
jgi:hypothetical protein